MPASSLPTLLIAAAGILLLPVACGPGVSSTNGLDAELRVAGAQFFKGSEPTPNPTGPTITSPQTTTDKVGQLNIGITGALSDNAAAVAFHLQGDIGYWTEAASAGDLTELGFSATLSFNPDSLPPDGGTLNLDLNAIDGTGKIFGPTTTVPLVAVPGFPIGANLVVSLSWDTESDLDLHVITPDGTEIWSQKRSVYQAPTYPRASATPATIEKYYGYLDFDSNRECVIDGRREENGIWQMRLPDGGPNPPLGHYQVRIDTWSLCGKPSANYHVNVYAMGQLIGQASGEMVPFDTRPPHGAGAGQTVLTFDITPDGGMADAGPDAGVDAGADGGPDAGPRDAG
jgi:hypothetical protein